MGSSLSKSKTSFFKPIKDLRSKGVRSRDVPVLVKPNSAKPNNFFAQKETPSIAKRNRRRNNKNASVAIKKKKKVTKSLIGRPTNFQHTTHIGAGEVRSGQLDAEQFKSQMLDIAAAINYSEEKTTTSDIPRFYAEDAMKDFQLGDKNWENLIEKAKNQPSLRKMKQASMQRGLMEANHRKHREMAKSSLNAKKSKMNEPRPIEPKSPRFTAADYVVPPGMAIPRKPASMEQKITIAPKKAEDILWSPTKLEHSQDYYTSVSSRGSSYISLPPTPLSMVDSSDIVGLNGRETYSKQGKSEFEPVSKSNGDDRASERKMRRPSYANISAAEKYSRRKSSSSYTSDLPELNSPMVSF
ncbi:hypothetical protein INT44_002577 [Umbelopsis vinacea]|uniref:CRIB domain-containing protein n=1 Tax=Umbelopsis vinacea TaxID=44442 RepID=A0A8H7PEP6_9FUNG|nr:hypothetical protein INT44_002577 [Umbelopsis vinacea]